MTVDRKPPIRAIPWLLMGALGLPVVIALAAFLIRDDLESPSLVTQVGALVAVLLMVVASRYWSRALASVWLTLVLLGICLAWPEAALRVQGFRHETEAVVQFGYPDPEALIRLDRDPELFWKLPTDLPFVNSMGFIGPEIEIPKPKDVFRVAFFGDSCTAQGYPKTTAALLNDHGASKKIEAVNLAVEGYSSHQGKVLAKRWIDSLEPDLCVVYFGWNDHWQAYGTIDEERHGQDGDPPKPLKSLMKNSRLAQWLAYRLAPKPLGVPRVPLENYRSNLKEIVRVARQCGARVLLLTAPSTHEALGVPDYLTREGFVRSDQEALDYHRDYNEAVREIAESEKTLLLDLALESTELDSLEAFFMKDGIHYKPKGLNWLAIRIGEVIQSLL